MTLADVETRVRNYLGPDTVEAPYSQADIWTFVNEAHHEYVARFTNSWKYGTIMNTSDQAFLMGDDVDGQWIECEGVDAWDNVTVDPSTGQPVYVPLRRASEGQVLFMTRSRGDVGRPNTYSLALRDNNPFATRTRFRCRVYPIPDGSYRYRPRIRTFPQTELYQAANPLLNMDDEQGEQLSAMVAARMAETFGYAIRDIAALTRFLPDTLAAELDIANARSWPFSTPRGVETVQ